MQVVASPDGYGESVMALDVHSEEFQARLADRLHQRAQANETI